MKKLILFLFALVSLAAEKGFEYQLIRNHSSQIHILRVDPNLFEIQLLPALDDGLGVESVGSMCARKGAKAGINGSFFDYDNKFSGLPRWTSKMNGLYYNISSNYHPAFGWSKDGKLTLFDHVMGEVFLEADKKLMRLSGMNGNVEKGKTYLFTPWFHRTTLTTYKTQEAIIENGAVTKMEEKGSNIIPQNGFILASDLGDNFIPYGSKNLRYKIELIPEKNTGSVGQWNQVDYVLSSFPMLIRNGKRHAFNGEGPGDYSLDAFINTIHPRSAVGIRKDGTWIFVVIDGGAESEIGVTLKELADLMEKENCVNAINLDGGGSSTLVIDGKYMNLGDDKARRVGNALLIFPR
ncbi:MAG: hypothetical protein ChlgKO_02410 [Chlamydiales bacterium]